MPDTVGWMKIRPNGRRCADREGTDAVAGVHGRIDISNRAARDKVQVRPREQTADPVDALTALAI